ncbi:porin family protein [bacterium]|nr:porin family protein [bacterium]
MKKIVMLSVLFTLMVPTAQAGIRVGPYLSGGIVSYDDINVETLAREEHSTGVAFIGVNIVRPVLSGVFLSAYAGAGMTLSRTQTTPLPPGAGAGNIEVTSKYRAYRAALDISSLIGESTFLFAGGGYDMIRLRFAGDINEVNADSDEVFVEAGIGYMFTDDHLLRLKGTFNSDRASLSLSYTVFMVNTGY